MVGETGVEISRELWADLRAKKSEIYSDLLVVDVDISDHLTQVSIAWIVFWMRAKDLPCHQELAEEHQNSCGFRCGNLEG